MAGVKIRRGSVLLDLGLVRAIGPLWIAWLLLMPSVAQAQFTFTTNADNTITITGYTGTNNVVIIPGATNGYPVTTIGTRAFTGCTNLTSVMIPNSVTNIGSYAFYNCTSLTSVTIPDSVTSIGYWAFYYNSSLTNVTIGNSVTTIGRFTFSQCVSLTSVTIGNSITSIGDHAFYYCSNLTSVMIPNSVTNIGNYAFDDCYNLTNVTIGNRVTNIGDDAFSFCFRLTNVVIPDSVTIFGSWVFNECSTLTNVTIGDSVTSIGDGAFYDCPYLANVTIPSSVNTIGNYAFCACIGLTSVTIPNSVTSIGSYAFSDCTNLHQAYFQGDAPTVNGGDGSLDSSVFAGESGTVYYVPGTTGWGATFGGWPTLHVIQTVHESGFIKDERWDGYVVSNVVNNAVPATPNYQMAVPEWGISQDNSAGHTNFVRRISGYFVPPQTQLYNFHLTSDDDSILFLSTDDTPGHKQQIASQAGWNGGARWDWGVIGGGTSANDNLMTHSETWSPYSSPIPLANQPYSGGILLNGGQRYYIEQDMHQGGGGANVAATWTYWGDPDPAVGTETQLKGTNIQMNVNRCSYVAFTQEPQNIANAKLGSTVAFRAAGTTDSQVSIGGINGFEEDYANKKIFFQWFTNGVAVPGANSSFVLMPVTADMVGVPVMCQTRAMGFTDDALNPIWTNSTSATITSVVAAAPPGLIGHFISGTADLNDSANYVAPGTYYGVPARATTSSRFYYFTNDVPYGAPTGAVSLHLNNYAIAITNTSTSDSGYVVDTFDGSMKNAFTVMCWAKGSLGSWNTFVAKGGDSGVGWALRTGQNSGQPCWTVRGNAGTVLLGTAIYGNPEDMAATSYYNDGLWHHYAGVYDSTATNTTITTVTNVDPGPPAVTNVTYTTNVVVGMRSLYVDGNLVARQIGEGAYTLNGAGHLTLGTEDLPPGNNYGNSGYLTATIYDVRIYNYALTVTQIWDFPHHPIPITGAPIPSFVTTNNVTYAQYNWSQCGCEGLVGIGPVIRNGSNFSYDFDAEVETGVICPLICMDETTNVALGTLAPGDYNLITTSWGVPVMTNVFNVPGLVLQSAGFAGDGSFQLQLQNGITNANYVLQSSTNLLDWTSLSTNSLAPVLTDTNPVLSGPRYYRVQIIGQ